MKQASRDQKQSSSMSPISSARHLFGSETNARIMRSFSVSPIPGPRAPDSNEAMKTTLSSGRKPYPEPTATALRGRESTTRPIQTEFSCWSTIMTKLVVGSMAFVCFVWTLWLILLTIKPNDTVNWVMKTENFDNGTFWLMVDPSAVMNCFSVCGLSLVVLSYAFVVLKLFQGPKRVRKSSSPSRIESMTANLRRELMSASSRRRRNKAAMFLSQTALLLVKDDAYAVKIARVWIKVVDLAVESIVLYQILEAGFPSVLVTAFTTIVGMNAVSCAVMMFLPKELTGLSEVIVDTLFDFLVVVGYPMLMVIYCLSSFSLDHTKIAINLDIFPTGSFERNASVIADPVQTKIIYAALKSLQIFSFLNFCLGVGVHVVFSFRLSCVVDMVHDSSKRPTRLYPKQHFRSAAVLVIFAISLIIFVEKSIWTSALACQLHPECAVKAHRWTLVEPGSLTQCPCLTLIDGDIAPKTFESWVQPVDVTTKVVQLATTGDLKTIQLTNRYFPSLPDELRRCKRMRHLSLVYTHTETLPSWVKEYVNLEYLYIEGTFDSSLLELPDGMLDNMSCLTFIHMGMHLHLQELPSFNGLRNLKALTLALFVSLIELPAFDSLYNLERLVLAYVPRIETLPDLSSLQKLKAFSVNDRGAWCCNGFLGDCNLPDPFCAPHPFWGVPPASCQPPTSAATNETIAVVEKFSDTVCRQEETRSPGPGFPSPDTIAQCGGVLYRRCNLPGFEEAMCYNARFMAVFCMSDPLVIEMRRRQIQLGVGDPCNPEYESWLGCK